MDFHVLIPARIESAWLPGKLLREIKGRPLIQYACERALDSGADTVIVATDSEEIASVCENLGVEVCLTLANYTSGVERLSEVVDAMEYEEDQIVVAMNADLATLPSAYIRKAAEVLSSSPHVKVTSLCSPIESQEVLQSSSVVKAVLNRRNQAVYFSRGVLPWTQADWDFGKEEGNVFLQHLGVYACRSKFFQDYLEWPVCPLERLENLEQLRMVWNGIRVQAVVLDKHVEGGVFCEEDLEALVKKVK